MVQIDTNTVADHEAINLEAEALGDEFNRLMTTSKYKGKGIFVTAAGSEYVSMGGRDAEMTFGIGTIDYSELYTTARTISGGGPNHGASLNCCSPSRQKSFGICGLLWGER